MNLLILLPVRLKRSPSEGRVRDNRVLGKQSGPRGSEGPPAKHTKHTQVHTVERPVLKGRVKMTKKNLTFFGG